MHYLQVTHRLFYAATDLNTAAIAQVQTQIRQRILRAFVSTMLNFMLPFCLPGSSHLSVEKKQLTR
jgi:hypothetical protein